MENKKRKRHDREILEWAEDLHICEPPPPIRSKNYTWYLKELIAVEVWAAANIEGDTQIDYQPKLLAGYKSGWEAYYIPDAIITSKSKGKLWIVEVKNAKSDTVKEARKQAKVYRDIYLIAHPELEPKRVLSVGI